MLAEFWLKPVALASSTRFAPKELSKLEQLVVENGDTFWRLVMATLAVEHHPLAQSVNFDTNSLIVELVDGRTISVPLTWFPPLSSATEFQLKDWEILGDGEGIHWPQLDEDLSVNGILVGNQGRR